MTKEVRIMEKDGPIAVIIVLVLLIGSIAFAMAHEPEEEEGGTGGTGLTVQGASNAFATSGDAWMITAAAVYANLYDGYTGNDPYIIDVRGAEIYAAGHVPTAVNIPWREVTSPDNLATLPMNKQIVVYCYTGHTATQVVGALKTIGYNAVTMRWAFCSWTTNETMAGSYFKPTDTHQFPIVTGSSPGTWADGKDDIYKDVGQGCGEEEPVTPAGGGSTGGGDDEDIAGAANDYFTAGRSATLSAQALYDNLADGDASNDPFVMSIRSASQYATGHIPGAVQFSWQTLFTDENLSKLPDDDTQIVVVCYTGHTASMVTAILGINGYNTTALRWGMTSWSDDATVAPGRYNRGSDTMNYEVVTGSEPGTIADAVLAGPTDEEIIYEAAYNFLSAGARFYNAADLAAILDDGDDTNDPFVLSIRGESDYEAAHIPGAVRMDWRTLFAMENLLELPSDGTMIVVVCYTGQTAGHVTAGLNILGYNASTLRNGMCSWTPAACKCFDAASAQQNYPVVSGTEPGTTEDAEVRADDGGCGGDTPVEGGEWSGSSEEWEIIRHRVDTYFSTYPSFYTTNTAVYNNLYDGWSANDPFVLSIRGADVYAAGHLPTAVNIGYKVLLEPENLEKLPTDRQIVVYCYTGHTAAQTDAVLGILGYESVSMKFGMCSWSSNTTVNLGICFSGGENYPIITGSDPGDWDDGEPAEV
jgi:rhodanese-related sulfurtransferase